MDNRKPEFLIDLRSKSQASVGRPLRSPRLHVAGEAPPELSPLDALRLQSQLLAKQLEVESARQGRRMSRLPPLTTESPLIIQGRSDYFRSMSHDSGSDDGGDASARQAVGLGFRTDIDDDLTQRPVSVHPRMSVAPKPDGSEPVPALPNMDSFRQHFQKNAEEQDNYFDVDARRDHSPTPLDRSQSNQSQSYLNTDKLDRVHLSRSTTQDSFPAHSPVSTYSMASSPEKLQKMHSFDAAGLLPPRPSFSKRTSSILSSQESTDGDAISSLSTSIHSQGPRKFSASSSVLSPGHGVSQRSPSISSDASGLPRPSYNFSRPLSRAGTPGLDIPVRQSSADSQGSFLFTDETVHTPISMAGDGFSETSVDDHKTSPAPSYIYSKFSLPRGKLLQRASRMLLNKDTAPLEPPSTSHGFSAGGQLPPSPPTRPSSSAGHEFTRSTFEPSKLSTEVSRPGGEPSPNLSVNGNRHSEDSPRGRPLTSPLHELSRSKTAISTTTSDSASTIKAPTPKQTMAKMSAEEHVNKAVELHENGSLQESTWHLRHAAKQGHTTGMLLYALACRHGWGMRANQSEGVEWLKKAQDAAHHDIEVEEEQKKEGKSVDVLEHKARKAQFALSVYELGVSYMNGWGIEQNKALALRCFEMAAGWGDVDALAESGFCYAQGIGCKKNLKKSAKYYREAEAKGMSMVGNSWIHKSKYDDDDADSKKSRSKSRTRKGLFSRKAKA
ncbi:protein DSF2 [Podospora conica]|nr:protein DSF2 [Schizothecium conicum]